MNSNDCVNFFPSIGRRMAQTWTISQIWRGALKSTLAILSLKTRKLKTMATTHAVFPKQRRRLQSKWLVCYTHIQIHFMENWNWIIQIKNVFLVANAYLKKIPDHMSVIEGEKLQIHCKAFGTDPKITWSVGEYNNDLPEITQFMWNRFSIQTDAFNFPWKQVTIKTSTERMLLLKMKAMSRMRYSSLNTLNSQTEISTIALQETWPPVTKASKKKLMERMWELKVNEF